jgi:hypothetical protein
MARSVVTSAITVSPMSDDSTAGWMPPQPASTGGNDPVPVLPERVSASANVPPPPPPGWSAAPPDESSHDGPIGERSGPSKKILIGAVIGVLAIGAAGVFAVTQMSGGNDGGAASPEELGEAVMESLDQEDMLGVIDLLLPGERDTFSEPAQELISELTRLEVLTDDASLDDLNGFDITLADRNVLVETTNVDDIVNITMNADATATIDGEELPIGRLITDTFGDEVDMGELDTTESGLDFAFPMTAVENDGRWYISAFYTTAENARKSAGIEEIPVTGIEAKGGDSPEGAIDVVFDAMGSLDLTALIGSLNPNEAEALQRYAPLFIDEPQAALDEIPASVEVTDVEYAVEGSGSTRWVSIERVRVEGTIRCRSASSSPTAASSPKRTASRSTRA